MSSDPQVNAFPFLACEAPSGCNRVTAHVYVRAVPALAGSRDLIYRCAVCGAERPWGRVYDSVAEREAADLR